jgi:hypothetical protein
MANNIFTFIPGHSTTLETSPDYLLLVKHGVSSITEDDLWTTDGRNHLFRLLPKDLVDLIQKVYELIELEDDCAAFTNAVNELTDAQRQELVDIGYLKTLTPVEKQEDNQSVFKSMLDRVLAKISGKKYSAKEIDNIIRETINIDECKIFEKCDFYEEEFPSVVRSSDYPEFANDESGQARKKDTIIELAKKKYGKSVVYHYSNILRLLGSTIRMQQAACPTCN